jgi:hypothetical protein
MNDDIDPFNRTKLSIDMVVPCPELKERIMQYKAQKDKEREENDPSNS